MKIPNSSKSVWRRIGNFITRLTWTDIVQLICAVTAVLLVVVFAIKLANPAFLVDLKLEVVLIALAVALFFPYITRFEALGVKVEISKQVDKVTNWANATPYYILASEYEEESDFELAEQYFSRSLNLCPDFWPSIFGLASVYDSMADDSGKPEDYDKAIRYYQRVLELEPTDVYTLNNLAAIYLSAPSPIKNYQKAREYAEKALDIIQSFGTCLYYKAEALNYQGNFQEAGEICGDIINHKLMIHDDDLYWVYYEQALANSNLGKGLKTEDLGTIYHLAEHSGDVDNFIEVLGREMRRFKLEDRAAIQAFLSEHSPAQA